MISFAIARNNPALLAIASLVAGFAEANIVTAQSAIADVVAPTERNRQVITVGWPETTWSPIPSFGVAVSEGTPATSIP